MIPARSGAQRSRHSHGGQFGLAFREQLPGVPGGEHDAHLEKGRQRQQAVEPGGTALTVAQQRGREGGADPGVETPVAQPLRCAR